MSDPGLRRALIDAAGRLNRLRDDMEGLAANLDVSPIVPFDGSARWVVALPFYWCGDRERGEVTRRIFRHYAQLRDEIGVRVTGLGSEGKVSRAMWGEFFDDDDYREYPQTFTANHAGAEGLRAKFDETIRATRFLRPERVFIGGSDDLIDVDWFRKAFESDADLVGITGGATIVEMKNSQPRYVLVWDGHYAHGTDVEFCGGGLVLSRGLLEAWGWAPFAQPGDEVGIERRARAEGRECAGYHGAFYAVKGGKVLNPYSMARLHGAREATVAEIDAFRARWDALG